MLNEYGSQANKEFVEEWLKVKQRPGFYERKGAPFTDWDAWAWAIREKCIDDEGYWIPYRWRE